MDTLCAEHRDLARELENRGLGDLPNDFWTAVLEVFYNAVTAPSPENIRLLINDYDRGGLMLHLVRSHQGGGEILHTVSGDSINTTSPEKTEKSEGPDMQEG
ncbi:unnamed protein product [Symbiodinium sp. CCMP2592]|nr:unnamed protein product [Symbiodinium sp. CCMP2592]